MILEKSINITRCEDSMKYYTDGSSTIGVKSAYCVTDCDGKIIEYKENILNRGKYVRRVWNICEEHFSEGN